MSKHYAIFGAGLSAQAACRLAQAKGLSVVLIDEAGEGDQATFEASDLEGSNALFLAPDSPRSTLGGSWRKLRVVPA